MQSTTSQEALKRLNYIEGHLDGHLHTCVVEGVRDGREEQVVGELLELYQLASK